MNIKNILIISMLTVLLLGCIGSVSAGGFDNKVECDIFKFDCPDGFYQEEDIFSNGVLLADDGDKNCIIVAEQSKENYTDFMQREYKNESDLKVFNDVKEDNVRFVSSINRDGIMSTFTHILKDGHYYMIYVGIQHDSDNESDKDIQIIKDIYNSIERK